jgi:hypothetical protein
MDVFASVEVVVHSRAAQACTRGDGLKIGRFVTAFGDHFARGAKNARPSLGRVGSHRSAPSPADGKGVDVIRHEQTLWHC